MPLIFKDISLPFTIFDEKTQRAIEIKEKYHDVSIIK